MKSFLKKYLIDDIAVIVCDYMTIKKNFYKYNRCVRELNKISYYFKLYCDTTNNNKDRIKFFKWFIKDGSNYVICY
jgi:hypothetical protein